MSPDSSLAYLLAVIFFACTPGPGVFAIIARALILGWRESLLLITGIIVSDIIYLLFACYGLAFIADHFYYHFIALRYLGVAYLVYLGWRLWFVTVDPVAMANSNHRTYDKGLLQGLLISASNPKVMLFFIAIFTQVKIIIA